MSAARFATTARPAAVGRKIAVGASASPMCAAITVAPLQAPTFASSAASRLSASMASPVQQRGKSNAGGVSGVGRRRSVAAAAASANEFLRNEGLSAEIVAAIEAKYPDLSKAGVDTVLRPKITLLKKQAGLSDPAKLGAVLSAQPRALLAASLERHLKPTVDFYTNELALRRTTLARIAALRPVLLTYDVAETILPKVEFFRGLGLTTAQIRSMVAASPDLLSIGIGNDLQPTVAWIRSIGIDGRDLAHLLAHHPTIFHNPLHIAKENVKLLRAKSSGAEAGSSSGSSSKSNENPLPRLGLDDAQAAKVMLGAPVLFRRPLTGGSMRSKLRYWSEGIGKSYAELSECPIFLERGLKSSAPRIEFAKKIASGSLPRNVAPLLEGPDAKFASEKLGSPGEEKAFEQFRVEWGKTSAGKWGVK